MLTKLTIRNFKRFEEVEIELGNPVAFIGPNNSGKTSAMQALALWDIGLKRWNEKRLGKGAPEKRPGVTVNRRDLVAIPVPNARLLWQGLHVRDASIVDGKQQTQNVRMDVIVEGVSNGLSWTCGLEFDYANEESFYCRPLRLGDGKTPARMPVPEEAVGVQVAFLPPMSGLAATETRLDKGAVDVRVGEGRTAEVLRNLCFRIHEESLDDWRKLARHVRKQFRVDLDAPRYVAERGEIAMSYRERNVPLDLSSGGRGLQQTMLILSYMYANPGAVLLLDEPDAHLEILRQREIYRLITDAASDSGSQIIAASHSEVILNEAAGRDIVIAFVGKPHRLDDRGSQALKALKDIRFEDYYQAEQTGWVLYLEGSTDLAILQALARRLDHPAATVLERPFVNYVGNQPKKVLDHYYGIREALPNIRGVAIFDRLPNVEPGSGHLECLTWKRREIENYICSQSTLESYARASTEALETTALVPPFGVEESSQRVATMREAIGEVRRAMATLRRGSPWDGDAKVSDDFLTPLFQKYFEKIGLHNLMNKKSFYELAEHVPNDEIDDEIVEKLDAIVRVAESATPGDSEY